MVDALSFSVALSFKLKYDHKFPLPQKHLLPYSIEIKGSIFSETILLHVVYSME